MTATLDDFTKAMAQAGLTLPATIIPDGKIHRFASNGRADDDSGWYVLHGDGVPAGAFGDWRTGLKETWCAKSDKQMTSAERDANRQRIEKFQREREPRNAAGMPRQQRPRRPSGRRRLQHQTSTPISNASRLKRMAFA